MGCSAPCVSLEYSAWWLLRRLHRSDKAIRSRRIGGMRYGWHSCWVLVSSLRCGCLGKKTKHCGIWCELEGLPNKTVVNHGIPPGVRQTILPLDEGPEPVTGPGARIAPSPEVPEINLILLPGRHLGTIDRDFVRRDKCFRHHGPDMPMERGHAHIRTCCFT